jgi:hypothetical protein
MLHILRAELATRRERGGGAASEAPALGRRAALRARLRALLGSVDTKDEQTWSRLRPALIQAVLVAELGESITRHPEFPTLLETLDRTMADEPGLWAGLLGDLAGPDQENENSP